MLNFTLQCTGADFSVDAQDVEDEDQWPQRLEDLQSAHLDEQPADYPLISRDKAYRSFRQTVEDFCESLIEGLHRSALLYDAEEKIGSKLQSWLGSMADGGNRAFRHTAVVLSISMASALCDIADEITSSVSTSRKQLESEKRKKTPNKGRINTIQTSIRENEERLETIDGILRDGFDALWIHRYRDIDPKIRTECFVGLARWIQTYRQMFFESQYVRYLGWGLSDMVTQVRAAVVQQLRRIYELKSSVAALRTFTGRFLRRLIEMATRDADVGVRVSTVELLGSIRDMGLMEGEDVDAVGQLVFDAEPRIRKAAGRFFAANLQEIFDSTTEEMAEDLNEVFADDNDDDFESPKRSWIKYKCLVDLLQAYDGQRDGARRDRQRRSIESLTGSPAESRFFLATEAIYPHMEELQQWQALSGYLLYDHSQATGSPARDEAINVRKFFALEEGQDIILLEVLVCAVKLRILDISKMEQNKRGQKVKSVTDKIEELQEETAHSLMTIIPQLLNKFGAVPEAASAVLRLEHLIDLDKIQDLQKDATAYSSLLNDISRQFLTHSNQDVLAEATAAFLHARSSEETREVMENKIQELWDDMIDILGSLSQNTDVQNGSSLRTPLLTDLTNTVTRISNLASIIDCTGVLETIPSTTGKKRKQNLEAPFNTLIHLARRGLREAESDREVARLETELVVHSLKTLLLYFMWKVQGLTSAIKAGQAPFNTAYFESLTKSRDVFVATLTALLQKRSILDGIRFAAVTTLLDVQTLFGTLRHIAPSNDSSSIDEDVLLQAQGLAQEISPATQAIISRFHTVAERTLAKRLKRDILSSQMDEENDEAPLESAQDIKDLPSDSDSDVDDDDDGNDSQEDDNDGDGDASTARLRATIFAEQQLCELTGKVVLAIIGRVLDGKKLMPKLLRNKTRLGHNYKEVVAYLEERKRPPQAKKSSSAQEKTGDQNNNKAEPAKDVLAEDPIIDDDDDDDDNEKDLDSDDEENLRRRGLVEDGVDDPIVDDENDNDNDDNAAETGKDQDGDEIMGD